MKYRKALAAAPVAGAAVILGQVLYAAHRPDLPSFDNNHTSCALGDPGLPGLHLAALGDSSITAPGVDRPDDAYIRRVAKALTDRYFVHLQSFAIGGAKAHEVVRDQLIPAVEWKPDLAVVSIGGNDAIRAVPARYFEEQLDHIVSSLLAAGSLVCVVGVGDLGSIPRLPGFLSRYLTVRSGQFDKASERVSARYPGVAKVDVRGDLSKAFWELPETFSRDQFHGSSFGHLKFAEAVLPTVEQLLAGAQFSTGRWSEQ